MHLKQRQRHNNPNTKSQNAHQISSQVANKWNGLPEAPTLAVFFERISDTTLKEHESKFNFKSDCSPVANQSSKPIAITQEGMAAADDLDI